MVPGTGLAAPCAIMSAVTDTLASPTSGAAARAAAAPAGPRTRARLRAAGGWLLLAAFAVQLALVVPRHEPWFDEAQSWLLARDVPVWELFTEQLRYEGTPGLWHLLLLGPARLGAPYATLQVIGAVAALIGAWVLVRRAPFPLALTAGLLFSFFIGYQYAVVARSYTLLPPLLFGLAALWHRRVEHSGLVVLLLGLLATTSLHSTLIAGCLAAVHLGGLVRDWSRLGASARWRNAAGLAALAVLALVIAVLLWPPDDLSNAAEWNLDPRHALAVAPARLNDAFTDLDVLTGAVLAVSALWFLRTRTFLLWALPTASLVLLSVVKYHRPWHEGLPFLVWVFALWVSLERPGAPRGWQRAAALSALAAVLVVQCAWWWPSFRYDLTEPYAGGEELAGYLATLDDDTVVWMQGFHSIAAAPYFAHNPFANYNGGDVPASWSWSLDVPLQLTPEAITAGVPDVFVYGYKLPGSLPPPPYPAYRLVRRIDAGLVFKGEVVEPDGFLVYERR